MLNFVIQLTLIGHVLSQGGHDEALYRGLELHNKYRRMHNVKDLVLDGEINTIAQRYAEVMARTGRFEHSHQSRYGENLAVSCWSFDSDGSAAEDAVRRWYDEIKLYDYKNPKFDAETGHFTQVVWKDTEKLGIGIAKGRYNGYNECYYVVANYYPPGNYINQFENNVLRLIEQQQEPKAKIGLKNEVISKKNKKTIERVRKIGLKLHNKYRRWHNASDLYTDKNLNALAQTRALILAQSGKLLGSDSKSFGENLYSNCLPAGNKHKGAAVIAEAVNSWYNQIEKYNFNNPMFYPSSAYFTQLLWKSSQRLGIGIAEKRNCVYVVAKYDPPGNVDGDFKENVSSGKTSKKHCD